MNPGKDMACNFAPALNKAMELFSIIEDKAKDNERGGYYEAFSRTREPIEDVRMSPNDANHVKSKQ